MFTLPLYKGSSSSVTTNPEVCRTKKNTNLTFFNYYNPSSLSTSFWSRTMEPHYYDGDRHGKITTVLGGEDGLPLCIGQRYVESYRPQLLFHVPKGKKPSHGKINQVGWADPLWPLSSHWQQGVGIPVRCTRLMDCKHRTKGRPTPSEYLYQRTRLRPLPRPLSPGPTSRTSKSLGFWNPYKVIVERSLLKVTTPIPPLVSLKPRTSLCQILIHRSFLFLPFKTISKVSCDSPTFSLRPHSTLLLVQSIWRM